MAPKAPAYDAVRAALGDQWDLLSRAVEQLNEADLARQSRLPGWRQAEVVAHLTMQPALLRRLLEAPSPETAEFDLSRNLAGTAELAALIDESARAAAGAGRLDLGAAVGKARPVLDAADSDRLLTSVQGSITLVDYLVTRLVEAVVHGLDLDPPVQPDRRALKLVVKALAGVLAERAPGHHVEARIPPYAAVQCVAGPRHTRGTPPNVVEADPVAFVELCTGRLAWADARADGRVRTWGDRADLSPWLPLLT